MKVRRICAPLIWVALGLLAVAAAGCQQSPSTPDSAPAFQPSPTVAAPTPAPTSAPTAIPTAVPTAPPTATRPPSTAVRPTATRVPQAGVRPTPGPAPSLGADPFAEVMPEMLAEMLSAMLPSQPVPQGSQATLSREDLEGRWSGWITFETVKLEGATPEEQEACESQMAAFKGKQLPTDMEFAPRSDGEGTVTIINKQEGKEDNRNDPIPYRYRGGVLTFQVEEEGVTSLFQGRTVRTDGGHALVGSWKFEGGLEPGSAGTTRATIEGTWVLNRRLSTSSQDTPNQGDRSVSRS